MKVTVLHGSPRKGKNSDTLVEYFLSGLNNSSKNFVNHFYLNDLIISSCQGCLHCSTPPYDCKIIDDMQMIYNSYRVSDLIVWASPMYWGYLTSQIKKVQDRMEALAWNGFGDKIFVVILTYRHHFKSVASMFQRIAPHFNIKLHLLECCTYEKESRKDIPVMELVEKLEEAYELGVYIRNEYF